MDYTNYLSQLLNITAGGLNDGEEIENRENENMDNMLEK